MIAHIIDAVAGQRMGAQIGILALPGSISSCSQDLEELQQAARRLMGAVEEGQRGVVGGRFLRHREGQEACARRRSAPPRMRGGAGVGVVAGRRGGRARHHGDDAGDGGVVHRLLAARRDGRRRCGRSRAP